MQYMYVILHGLTAWSWNKWHWRVAFNNWNVYQVNLFSHMGSSQTCNTAGYNLHMNSVFWENNCSWGVKIVSVKWTLIIFCPHGLLRWTGDSVSVCHSCWWRSSVLQVLRLMQDKPAHCNDTNLRERITFPPCTLSPLCLSPHIHTPPLRPTTLCAFY